MSPLERIRSLKYVLGTEGFVFSLHWGLQFAVYRLQVVAMVVGCKNGLAGFFADEDFLKADKSLLERETGSDT